MSGLSTADGFMGIFESLAVMIKYMANEPSVGLFYIQQHTQKAVPNLINLRHDVGAKSQETTLHTEDLEDSIAMVKSMKEYGSYIADEMIKDINQCLFIISTKQFNEVSRMGITSSGVDAINSQPDGERTSYISSIFKSAKQTTENVIRPKVGIGGYIQEKLLLSFSNETTAVQFSGGACTMPITEADRLHLPRPIAHEGEESKGDIYLSSEKLPLPLENYDEFKADKEAKLEKWLEG